MDRQLLAVLIDPIKRELGASDAAMGLSTGSSFAALHVMATIPVAVWADRSARRSIVAYGLAIWSGLTLLTGLTRSHAEIFVVRVGVGIAEAAGGWLAWFPALTSACVFPLGLGFVFAANGNVASALLAPASFLASSYRGPVYGAVQTLADPRTRALAGSLVTTTNAVLGLGLAPPLIGWLNDQGAASRGADSIRDSLGLILLVHLVAAVFLLRAGATLRRDLSKIAGCDDEARRPLR